MRSPGTSQFQQTSAESFEASLMAGGYGVYKTTEWVRQPQFTGEFAVPPPLLAPGPSKPPVFKKPEPVAPLTEKQRRKKQRVDKFRNGGSGAPQRLVVGEVRGMGRVLVDEAPLNGVYYDIAAGRRPAEERRRKKAAADLAMRERERRDRDMMLADEGLATHPNWPDDDFPWRLRAETRIRLEREDRALRIRLIEKFFEQDTEDEELEDAVERSILEREQAAARDV
ncbi:hypothetical protein C8J57DRAFT_1725926 [Mycena rebaudengoi]|nr:hypothetical protein C8J57DRAFT_1725926 [Mycena rebaudengoi]